MRITVGTLFLVMGGFLHSIDVSSGMEPNKRQASPLKKGENLKEVGSSSGHANPQGTSSSMSSPTRLSQESVEIKREYTTSPEASSSVPVPTFWENHSLENEETRRENPISRGTSSSMLPPSRVPQTHVETSSQNLNREGAADPETRRKKATKQSKRARVPESSNPPVGSHVYVQIMGGRILTGVLGFSTPQTKEPQDNIMIRIDDGRLMIANLHTMDNSTVPDSYENRCFIPIRPNLALAGTLGPYDSAKQMRNETNAYVIIQKPMNFGLSGMLLLTNGKIPAWLPGHVNHRT